SSKGARDSVEQFERDTGVDLGVTLDNDVFEWADHEVDQEMEADAEFELAANEDGLERDGDAKTWVPDLDEHAVSEKDIVEHAQQVETLIDPRHDAEQHLRTEFVNAAVPLLMRAPRWRYSESKAQAWAARTPPAAAENLGVTAPAPPLLSDAHPGTLLDIA